MTVFNPTTINTSGFVPYVGATMDVDLGTHEITAALFTGQYTNANGTAFINPDGSAVFANPNIIFTNAGDASFNSVTSVTNFVANNSGSISLLDGTQLTIDNGSITIGQNTGTQAWIYVPDGSASFAAGKVTIAPGGKVSSVGSVGSGAGGEYDAFYGANTDSTGFTALRLQDPSTTTGSVYWIIWNSMWGGGGYQQPNSMSMEAGADLTGGMNFVTHGANPIGFWTNNTEVFEARSDSGGVNVFGSLYFIGNTGDARLSNPGSGTLNIDVPTGNTAININSGVFLIDTFTGFFSGPTNTGFTDNTATHGLFVTTGDVSITAQNLVTINNPVSFPTLSNTPTIDSNGNLNSFGYYGRGIAIDSNTISVGGGGIGSGNINLYGNDGSASFAIGAIQIASDGSATFSNGTIAIGSVSGSAGYFDNGGNLAAQNLDFGSGQITYDVGGGIWNFGSSEVDISGFLNVNGPLNDKNNVPGSSGQFLSSTGSQVLWSSTLPTVAKVSLTNQSADITSTVLTGTAGLYRVEYSLQDTTSDITAGAVVLTIGYTDGAGATTSTATQVLTGLGRQSGTIFLQLASGNLTYATSHTGLFSSAKYALYITTEKL